MSSNDFFANPCNFKFLDRNFALPFRTNRKENHKTEKGLSTQSKGVVFQSNNSHQKINQLKKKTFPYIRSTLQNYLPKTMDSPQ